MSDPFKTVTSGSPLNISAVAWNRLMEIAGRQARSGMSTGIGSGEAREIFIKNGSGSTVNRFGILSVSGILVDHASNADDFLARAVFTGATPATGDKAFAILHDTNAAANEIVKATMFGVVQVQIDVTNANHGYADIKNADSAKLKSASYGPAQILWKESGTGTKWALVNLICKPTTIPAKIISVSGSFPTWTYVVQLDVTYNSGNSGSAKWVATGGTLTAVNRAEFGGTPNYTYGNGLLITSSSGQVNSTACLIKPIGAGTTVDLTLVVNESGNQMATFCEMNSAQ
jgi:hypothetical protein